MPDSPRTRPWPVLAAAVATVVVALLVVVVGAVSLAQGHGAFSGGVAAALIGWGLLVGLVGLAFGRGARWARGPVVAAGLLHVFSFGQMVPGTPWLALPALAAAAAVVCAVLPATNRWLQAS